MLLVVTFLEVSHGNNFLCLQRLNSPNYLAKYLPLHHHHGRSCCDCRLSHLFFAPQTHKQISRSINFSCVDWTINHRIQIRDLQASRTATADSQAVATLLRSVAKQKQVGVQQVYANSNTVHTGMLVTIGKSTKTMFTVTINADNNSYQLDKTTLIVPQANFVTK